MAGPVVRMAMTIGRELALAEVGLEPVERGPRRHRGRQDRRVGCVEPDVEERRAEEEQEGEGRDEDRDGVAHHPSGEARPRPLGPGRPRHPPDGESVDPGPEDGQDRGQERQRRGDRQGDDDRAGDPDRAQDHELEQDQPEQAEEHGQPAEEDGPSGRRDGDPDRRRDAVRAVGLERELLAEPAGHQQRVVDAETQPEQGREVEHEDAHRRQRGDDEDPGQRHDHRRATDHQRDPGRDQRAEDEEERERRQRQRHELAPLQVGLGDGLDVAVEGRAAGQLDRQARRLVQSVAEDRQGLRRIVRRQVEEDDVVGRVPVGRDLARREQVRHDARDVRRGRDVADRVGRGDLEGGRPRLERRAREDDDERRGRRPELGLEERLGPGRFEVVEDEPAGAQLARHLRGERDGDDEQGDPGGDDPPGVAHDETPESIEWGHVVVRLVHDGCWRTRPSYPRPSFRASDRSASIAPCSSS